MKKEDYFPEESVVKDSIYMMMKDTITCKLCNKILKNPMMCTSCQETYCENCLNNWVNICPNHCENPQYVENKSTKTLAEEFKTKKTLRKITPEETEKMRKEGKEISYLSSKKKSNFYIYFSHYIR